MNSIFITGSNGFVGTNLKSFLSDEFKIDCYNNSTFIGISQDTVIHLAGKAHDLKNITSSDEYYNSNTEFTKKIFDQFLSSNARVFITLSSVKAVANDVKGPLFEDVVPNPKTHYGKSKLLAEQYIFSKYIPNEKRVYILRPCMIHGPGNKGNLNLLYNFVSKSIPWPLGQFENSRSYLSIENLCFIIKELIQREEIPSGVYNVSDDIPLSTNELIRLIAESKGKNPRILKLNKSIITILAFLGDIFKLPLNTERLKKLTESYVVSNLKIKSVLGKPLPVNSKEGILRTFQSFNNYV